MIDRQAEAQICSLLDDHRVMTVATVRPDGWPQATTVGYVHDGLTLYFLCGPDSQKAVNLERDNRLSLTIDHDVGEVMAIKGLSMAGRASPVTGHDEVARIQHRLIQRYLPQSSFEGPLPGPDAVRVFRVDPLVISILDYSKGFGHTELVTVEQSAVAPEMAA